MAFAAAVYAGLPQGMEPRWIRAFGLASFAVSLPAAFYAAWPFYLGAWRAWKARRFNVDVTVTLGLLTALLSSACAAATGRGANFSDSLAGLVFFLLAGRWAVRRFEAGLALESRWFERLAPGHVAVRRGGALVRVPAAEARAGESVETGAGEYVPVDGVLAGDEAWMDTSLLTGESRASRLVRGDRVFAGYLNLKGRAVVRLTAPGGKTRIAALRRDLAALAAGRQAVPDGAGTIAKRFTLAVSACAAVGFLAHLPAGLPAAMQIATSVLIVSCACALALAVPVNRGLGLKRARALGFHFRTQAALEALRGARCVLFDKTGTLTFTRRVVAGWDWLDPWRNDGSLQDAALRALRAATAGSLHPVSLSVQTALEILSDDGVRAESVREIPHFGLVARVPGTDGRTREICLCKYGAWNEKGAEAIPPSSASPDSPLSPPAIAGDIPPADACVFVDGAPAALIRFTEEIKPEAARLMTALETRGLHVALLSGDNPDKVRSFAAACGIRDWRASLSPEAKRAAAEEYRKRYGRLLAVGDGFNDSLLFGSSDLAMAVAGGAADRLEGIDILATGDRPAALASLFGLADGVSRGIRRSYLASGLYNAGAIAAALSGWVTPLFAAVLMPLSSLSLCLIAWFSIPRRP
jgi:Cu2+-exporting ATPase